MDDELYPIFVTAPGADHKLINRVLLHLYDYDGIADDSFVMTSKDLGHYQRPKRSLHNEGRTPSSEVPVPEDLKNDWAGASIEEVEAFCLELDRSPDACLSTDLVLIFDSSDLDAKMCVLMERASEYEWPDEGELKQWRTERFNKVRVPWTTARICCIGLRYNIGFEDIVKYDSEPDEKGWWPSRGPPWSDLDLEPSCMVDIVKDVDRTIEELVKNGRA